MKKFELDRIMDTRLGSLSVSEQFKASLVSSAQDIVGQNTADAEDANPFEIMRVQLLEEPEARL